MGDKKTKTIDLPRLNLIDNSIVAGFENKPVELADFSHLDIFPIAASTGFTKRLHDPEQLLKNMELENIKTKNTLNSDSNSYMNKEDLNKMVSVISPPKTIEQRLKDIKHRRTQMNNPKYVEDNSCLDISNMSDLSSHSFLLSTRTKKPTVKPKDTTNEAQKFVKENSPSTFNNFSSLENQETILRYNEDDENKELCQQIENSLNGIACTKMSNLSTSSTAFAPSVIEPKIQVVASSFVENSIMQNPLDMESMSSDAFQSFRMSAFDDDMSNTFRKDDSCTGNNYQGPNLSGILDPQQVEIRQSMLSPNNPLKGKDRPTIDDFLQSKSKKLGSLDDPTCEKPSFGMGPIISPPKEQTFLDEMDETLTAEKDEQSFLHLPERKCGSEEDAFNLSDALKDPAKYCISKKEFQGWIEIGAYQEDALGYMTKMIQSRLKSNDSTVEASTMADISHDINELRLQKEQLARNINEPPSHPYEYSTKPPPVVNPPSPKRPGRFKMGTSSLKTAPPPVATNKGVVSTEINIRQPILVGFKSDHEMFQMRNPTDERAKLCLEGVKETLDGSSLEKGFLSVNSITKLDPKSQIPLTISLCPTKCGIYKSTLLFCLKTLDGTEIKKQRIQLGVRIISPDVDVTCDGKSEINFKIVPETCTVEKEVKIVNKSRRSIPVILVIKKDDPLCEMVTFSEKNTKIHLINPTMAALELPESDLPLFVKLKFIAPEFQAMKNKPNFETKLRMIMDNPLNDNVEICNNILKAEIGSVRVNFQKSKIPLVIKCQKRIPKIEHFKISNRSKFKLKLSASFSEEVESSFKTKQKIFEIEENQEKSLEIRYDPRATDQNEVSGFLILKVEPEGFDSEFPVKGILMVENEKPATMTTNVRRVQEPTFEALNLNENQARKETTEPSFTMIPKDVKLDVLLNRRALYFGCINSNAPIIKNKNKTYVVEELRIKNNTASETALTLHFSFTSNNFNMVLSEHPQKFVEKGQFAIEQYESITLRVMFMVKKLEVVSEFMIMKIINSENIQSNMKIPLYGYGGSQIFTLQTGLNTFQLTPLRPSVETTVFVNNGSRSAFYKLRCVSNRLTAAGRIAEELPPEEARAFPNHFVLHPQQQKEIVVSTLAPQSVIDRRSETLKTFEFARLEVYYGDEILRQRMKKAIGSDIKIKKLTFPHYLEVDFDFDSDSFFEEEDPIALDPEEDRILFYNSILHLVKPVKATVKPSNDNSSNINLSLHSDKSIFPLSDDGSNNIATKMTPGQNEIEIVPSELLINRPFEQHELNILNHSNQSHTLEIICKDSWLEPETKLCILPSNGAICVKFKINNYLASESAILFADDTYKTVIEILSENTRSVVDVTIVGFRVNLEKEKNIRLQLNHRRN